MEEETDNNGGDDGGSKDHDDGGGRCDLLQQQQQQEQERNDSSASLLPPNNNSVADDEDTKTKEEVNHKLFVVEEDSGEQLCSKEKKATTKFLLHQKQRAAPLPVVQNIIGIPPIISKKRWKKKNNIMKDRQQPPHVVTTGTGTTTSRIIPKSLLRTKAGLRGRGKRRRPQQGRGDQEERWNQQQQPPLVESGTYRNPITLRTKAGLRRGRRQERTRTNVVSGGGVRTTTRKAGLRRNADNYRRRHPPLQQQSLPMPPPPVPPHATSNECRESDNNNNVVGQEEEEEEESNNNNVIIDEEAPPAAMQQHNSSSSSQSYVTMQEEEEDEDDDIIIEAAAVGSSSSSQSLAVPRRQDTAQEELEEEEDDDTTVEAPEDDQVDDIIEVLTDDPVEEEVMPPRSSRDPIVQQGTTDNDDDDPIVTAQLVDDDELRTQAFMDARQSIIDEAISADHVQIIVPDEEEKKFLERRRCRSMALLLIIIVVVVIVAATTTTGREGSSSSSSLTMAPTTDGTTSMLLPTTWRQIGQVLKGDKDGYHYFGTSVDINSNGTVVAIGTEPDEDEQSYAEVYRLDEATESWKLLGNKIYYQDARSADAVFLSDSDSSEDLLVFSKKKFAGLLQFYALENGSSWTINKVFTGSNLTTYIPKAVPTNAIRNVRAASDGHFVAVLKHSNTSEDVVQVYTSSGYRKKGSPFLESDICPSGTFGSLPVGISRGGSVIVMGCDYGGGYVMLYHYGNNGWIRPGTNLSSGSQFASRSFGDGVAVSGDGSTVAVVDSRSFAESGSVTVFRSYGVGDWRQLGNVIVGYLNSFDSIDEGGVILSDDGNILGVNVDDFQLRTFRFNELQEEWDELSTVEDSNTDEYPCAISSDGTTLCCGSPFDLLDGHDVGLVTVYRLGMQNESTKNPIAENTTSVPLTEQLSSTPTILPTTATSTLDTIPGTPQEQPTNGIDEVPVSDFVPKGVYLISNLNDGDKCMDVERSSQSNEAPILLYKCYGTTNQRFRFTPWCCSGNDYQISAFHSNKCLDVPQSSQDEVGIVQYDCTRKTNQLFRLKFIESGGGGYQIRPLHSYNMCLDTRNNETSLENNIEVIQHECLNTTSQLWTLSPWKEPPQTEQVNELVGGWADSPLNDTTGESIIEGIHSLKVFSSGKCLDANSRQDDANGGDVNLWRCNGWKNQQWKFQRISGHEYEINLQSHNHNMCLDAASSVDHTDGGNVQVWSCNGWSNQRWIVDPVISTIPGEGTTTNTNVSSPAYYSIRVSSTGKCLEANNYNRDDLNDGGRVQVWTCNNGTNQQWIFGSFLEGDEGS